MSDCARRRGCTNTDEECLVCPFARECPVCRQPPGAPCRRPSGHNCEVHVPRVEYADKVALREHRDRVVEQLGETATDEWEERLFGRAEYDRRRRHRNLGM